jgi:nitrous oxide reductase
MSETNRRKFLAAAGAGAAAGVVGITAGPAFAGGTARSGRAARETVVAYVEDHHGSEVTLLVGEREIVVQDRDLVTAILNAAGGE